jgi:hypothetical protein
MGVGRPQTFQLRDCLPRITLCQFVQVVNACLYLCWEPLDVAIFKWFIGNVVLGVHQGISGRRLRMTRGEGGLGLWTPCWAFFGCHGALSLDA